MLGIIIPTKDNTKELFECLRSIKKSTSVEYVVYVADTGSSDTIKNETKNLLAELFKGHSKFIEYDYYNFSKINNDVVRNHLDDSIDVLIFCNNDIRIGVVGVLDMMNTAILFNGERIGTCGCRLLYPDKTIQHDGQIFNLTNTLERNLIMTHLNLKIPNSNHNNPNAIQVDGNTFALCAVLRSTFERIGMLSEEYLECFEDVHYNMRCTDDGLHNMLLPSMYWAYHHESTTRVDTDKVTPAMYNDYNLISKYASEEYSKTLEVAV